jgi:serine/threonine-protein kinase
VPISTTDGSLLGGRYRVLRRLGSGGMAAVLLCHDERLRREVAVKRLHADSPDDVERRFLREAKLGASLNHPNLVSVFDTITDDEGVLIVMEYVAGETLARALERGPLMPERAAGMVRDLGAALDHAHEQGVIHRDVKPGNVLLRRDGATKLADLGIATASDQTRITRSGLVLGSAAYMAPEQLDGDQVGPATDVYALAAVAYEALTGERARPGRTPMEIAHRIATTEPPDLRDELPGAPAAAAAALRHGMARDPAQRPRSAGELADRVAAAFEAEPATGTPLRGRPVAVPYALRDRPHRRRPALAVAVALALVALAAAAAIGTVLIGDDGGGERSAAGGQARPAPGKAGKQKKQEQKADDAQEQTEQAAQPAPAPAQGEQPAEEAAPDQPAAGDPARGAELNAEGFALIGQGDYAGAVPILREAVAQWPQDSRDIEYAYALFNLGQALNRSGRPAEAIPYLEKRLTWDDQRDVVQAELDLARSGAGQG